ncbi:hypothetical protein GQ53DRAFT_826506 [Thozetella sp. PMI_491]|nr:hypothetical protein GQ53DRAFT_826506 [Thozetella sp. PMI_491]
MAEVTFAKTFLTILDTKPAKITADHVEDPRNYPARTPYILPRMPKPMSKRTKVAPGAERSISVTVKSARNPPLDIKLPSQPLATSLLDIKTAVSEQASIPVGKLKLLVAKKPVPDSKVLKDVLEDGATSIELGLMVLGGAASIVKKDGDGDTAMTSPASVVAQGLSGSPVLETDEFWSDLKGFLQQRVRDEKLADELVTKWKKAR